MKVVVYSMPGCGWCTKLKNYLTSKNVAFTDVNVMEDKKEATYIVRRTNQTGVPVMIVDDEKVLIGFDQKEIDSVLGL